MRLLVIALALGCTSEPGPTTPVTPPPLPATPFVVSNPIVENSAPIRGAGPRPVSPPGSTSVVYVSLPPGTIPGASAVTIVNRQRQASATALVVDGGFDPVALAAMVGDTLAVTVRSGSGAGHLVSYFIAVRAATPPIVVRVSPPEHKRDVPLNASIVVTFSEPMDSASLAGAIGLSTGGVPVPGGVVIPPNTGDVLRAEFVPTQPLATLTTFTLHVGVGARDLDGEALADSVRSDFTTDSVSTVGTLPVDTVPPVVTILSPASGDTVPTGYLSFWVKVTDDHLSGMSVELQGDLQVNWNLGGSGDLSRYSGLPGWFNMEMPLGPGTYSFQMTANDASGNVGTSAPITVVFVAPDTQPRIVIRSFEVIEAEYLPGHWAYYPQLVVADAPGEAGLTVVGFELLSVPGLPAPRSDYRTGWKEWAQSRSVPPGQDTPLFTELYGDYEWGVEWAPYRADGAPANAVLTYRDGTGHFYSMSIQGPIVPGPARPGTYTGGCIHWMGPFFYPLSPAGCLLTARKAAR